MKQQIIENINKPDGLEKLYRDNKQDFRNAFTEISDDYPSDLVEFWKIRLAPENLPATKGFLKMDLLVIMLLTFVTGLLVKLPEIFPGIDQEFFYERDLAIIVFNGIILFAFWQNKIFDKKRLVIYGLIIVVLCLFMNLLPNIESDSVVLSMIHVPLFLWCLFVKIL